MNPGPSSLDTRLPCNILQGVLEDLKVFQCQMGYFVPPASSGSSQESPASGLCLPVENLQWEVGMGIFFRCPTYLNLLLLMERSSSCTLSFSWTMELLTLSLRLSQATLWRKLISSPGSRSFMIHTVSHGYM